MTTVTKISTFSGPMPKFKTFQCLIFFFLFSTRGNTRRGIGRDRSMPRPLLAVPNVTADPPPASVPITVLLYNGPLLCGFNVPIKGLRHHSTRQRLGWQRLV